MDILNNILQAREQRAQLRKTIADNGHASLSLTLNIPGYPKSNETINRFFILVLQELKTYLRAHRIKFQEEEEYLTSDSDGDFYLTPIQSDPILAIDLKTITEQFEENHLLGRFIDVDIVDEKGNPVSSGKMKTCFFCGEHPAISCMRENRHRKKELRDFIFKSIDNYLKGIKKDAVCRKLSGYATRSILYEISLTPKPGLVDASDSGIHTDMDYYTFVNSSSVISQFFFNLAQAGYKFNGTPEQILPEIRKIGLKIEAEMFDATNGVNTQKGIIFLMGLSLFVAAKAIVEKDNFIRKEFRNTLIKACAELDLELTENDKAQTHGEKCNQEFGYALGGGARAEAQAGFPTVFNAGLPELGKYKLLSESVQDEIEQTLKRTLTALMAECNDSNILYRSNLDVLNTFKTMSKIALDSQTPSRFDKNYNDLIEYCQIMKVSPGGSADLLATTLFIYFVEHTDFSIL